MTMMSASASAGVDVYDPGNGGFNTATADHHTDIYVNDSVTWYIKEGKHNITPAEDVPGAQKWGGSKGSGDLTFDGNPNSWSFTFNKAGDYFYYSNVGNEGSDNKGKLSGMSGKIHVTDPNATTSTSTTTTTTAPPPPPPTTDTTRPAVPAPTTTTAPAPAGAQGTHGPTPAAPAPTTTTPTNAPKDKKPKESTSTSTTAAQVDGPINLPDEAIVPNVTPNGTATQNGVVQPSSTPEGDAMGLLKEKHATKGVKLLIVTGLGIGALGIGTAGYKFAHRSSKYFPA
jgi:plastocyanin